MVNTPNATKPGAFATLGPRVVSSLIGFSIVVACVWFGWRTMLPMLMFVMVLGLREYRSMLRNRGLEVGGRLSAYGYGVGLLLSSVPGLPEPLPGVSWRVDNRCSDFAAGRKHQ